MRVQGRCPTCLLSFDAPPQGPTTCPICDTELILVEDRGPPAQPSTAAAPDPLAPLSSPPRTSLPRGAVGGLVLLLAAGTALAVIWSNAIHTAEALKVPAVRLQPPGDPNVPAPGLQPPVIASPLDVEGIRQQFSRTIQALQSQQPRPKPQAKPGPQSKSGSVVRSAEPLAVRVNRAIDRGVAYLKRIRPDLADAGPFAVRPPGGNTDDGLLGLALLSCGVPASDPIIKRLAASLRQRAPQLGKTYNVALTILFFDRLNNPADRGRIESLALRLVAGQSGKGDWGYDCPPLDERQETILRAYLWTPAASVLERPKKPSGPFDAPPSLLERALTRPGVQPPRRFFFADNSNTQFALLGLWAARRHKAPVSAALARVAQHFRTTPLSDGSWGYRDNTPTSCPSNTCAGLLGLAVEHGLHPGNGGRIQDATMLRGLRFLGATLARARAKVSPTWRGFSGVPCNDDLYFFWSLERMAVVYGLRVVGETEWYPWAAEKIVHAQGADGQWQNAYGAEVDTCFALLVLRRTNFATDLTAALRGRIPGQEPLPSATPRPGTTPPLSATEKSGDGKLGSALNKVPGKLQGQAAEESRPR